MTLLIRPAEKADAKMAVAALCRSISELCQDDHRDDPEEISSWLENKTVETWCIWIDHSDASVFVADEDGEVTGVGMVRSDGEILLNYVSPEARFRGISKAMLSALEAEASALGAASSTLESTHTARRFYLACGYTIESELNPLRMKKVLSGAL